MCVVIDLSACTQLTTLPSNVKEQTLHCTTWYMLFIIYYGMAWMDGWCNKNPNGRVNGCMNYG